MLRATESSSGKESPGALLSGLAFALFGKLEARLRSGPIIDLHASKACELLCYLLLRGERPVAREALADVLWGDAAAPRKYLRQSIWQLQAALERSEPGLGEIVVADAEWIHIPRSGRICVDVEEFERAYTTLSSTTVDESLATRLDEAVRLYVGDLLEGWYADWAVFERERLRGIYLEMLERLVDYCGRQNRSRDGVGYAQLALRREPAHERTHRHLMRLLYRSGDRTAALRQYERCASALRSELGVDPAAATCAVYEAVRADQSPPEEDELGSSPATPRVAPADPTRRRVLGGLHEVRRALDHARRVVDDDIAMLRD